MVYSNGNEVFNRIVLAAVLVASAVVFIIDIQFPLGVAGGVPYALVVMASHWVKKDRVLIGTGLLTTLLTVIGFFLSRSSEYIIMAGANRLMAITVIWATVWFVHRYRKSLHSVKKNEKRISALFEAATEGMIISDLSGKIVMVNKKAEELFGYSRDEIIGKKIETLVPRRYATGHPQYRERYYEDPKPRPMGQGRDLFGLRKNGKEFPVEISLNHFETEEGKFVISYVIDITQRKNAEDKLLQANKQLKHKAMELKQSNEELEQFAYVASHDLQEPLRMVASYTQLLARRYKDQLDEDANDFIEYAVDGARRMQELLNDLLQFSRVGTRAKPFKETAIKEVIENTLQNLKKFIEENNAEVNIESELPVLSVDKLQVTQLFQNLIQNAIKFKSVSPPKVWIRAEEQENCWHFMVKDNGVGIDSEHQDRIFTIFQRLHNRGAHNGSGIGLAICKKIVERHDGKIWVESEKGKGSVFHFTLAKGLETPQKDTFETSAEQYNI